MMTPGKLWVLNDGPCKIDGGLAFGQVPRQIWLQHAAADRKNRIDWTPNVPLLQVAETFLLVNTGLASFLRDMLPAESDGSFCCYERSQLFKQLRIAEVKPQEVAGVILNSARLTHAGGCLQFSNRSEMITPAFPRATYYLQRGACRNQTGLQAGWYDHASTIQPLADKGQLTLVEGDAEIVPGVTVRAAECCASGHQIVTVTIGPERVLFPGDLIPTAFHAIEPRALPAFTCHPCCAFEYKQQLLSQAADEGWLVVFPHADPHAGYIEKGRDGQLRVRPQKLAPQENKKAFHIQAKAGLS